MSSTLHRNPMLSACPGSLPAKWCPVRAGGPAGKRYYIQRQNLALPYPCIPTKPMHGQGQTPIIAAHGSFAATSIAMQPGTTARPPA